MTKLLYKLMTMVVGVLSGMLATAIFKRVWRPPPARTRRRRPPTSGAAGARC